MRGCIAKLLHLCSQILFALEIQQTGFKDLLIIKPKVFGDARGYFFESFNAQRFAEKTGLELNFVQDNESLSQEGVVRGLHFQNPPHAQDKLVRVATGAVLDVVVDLRKSEPTYGKSFVIELTEENQLQFFVPKGFAHGFATLRSNTRFLYKCTDYYHPETEDCLLYNDPAFNIDWKVDSPLLSDKDKKGRSFATFQSPFQ